MSTPKSKSMSSLFAGACFVLLGSTSLLPATATAAGIIEFYSKNSQGAPGDLTCSLPFEYGRYNFHDNDCKNDHASFFKLINVPSASYFELFDHPDCSQSDKGNFVFLFKTMKNNLSSETPALIESAGGGNVGSIAPGAPYVRLEAKYRDGQVEGKLSCVFIRPPGSPDN